MVKHHQASDSPYHTSLTDIMQRATALEQHAHNQYHMLDTTNPDHASWQRIERRYATIRGNAQHLLIIHEQRRDREQPLYRLRKYLHLL